VRDEYGDDYVTLTDEEGNDLELIYMDTVEMDCELYMCFIPADMDEDDEDYGLVILRVDDIDGEEYLSTVDDDDELERVFQRFFELLSDDVGDRIADLDNDPDGDLDNGPDGGPDDDLDNDLDDD